MGFFGFLFWLVVLWFAFRAWTCWQRRNWAAVGPRDYSPYAGWYDSGRFYGRKARRHGRQSRDQVTDHQEYIEALETRVTELEERLDFTERLLANRRETASSG